MWERRKNWRGERDNPVGRSPARCIWWRLQLATVNVSAVRRLWLLILWGKYDSRPCEGHRHARGGCSSNFLPPKVIIDIASYNARDLPSRQKAFMGSLAARGFSPRKGRWEVFASTWADLRSLIRHEAQSSDTPKAATKATKVPGCPSWNWPYLDRS